MARARYPAVMKRLGTLEHGFTKLELLACVVAVAVLVSLLFLRATFGTPLNAQVSQCKNNARSITSVVLLYSGDNGRHLPAIDASKYPGFQNPMTLGGGKVAPDSGISDEGRPLYAYVRDTRVFQCPKDRGYSGVAPTVAGECKSVFKQVGSSYAYALKDEQSCGLMGLTVGGDATKPRKMTDPELQSASNKVVLFEPPFAGPTAGPPPRSDQWHDRMSRCSVLAFLDGHSDWVPAAKENHGVVPRTREDFLKLQPARPYY